VKIISLNTWNMSGPSLQRWDVILEEVRGVQPDVIAFQEIFDDAWASEVQQRLGRYHRVAYPEPSGLIFLTRHEVEKQVLYPMKALSPTEDYGRYALLMQIAGQSGPVSLINTHLSWRPEESGIRQKQIEELLSFIDKETGVEPVFALGDFNSDAGTREMERMWTQGAFRDLYARMHLADKGYTWSRENPYTRSEDGFLLPERRIDYIYLRENSSSYLNRLKSVEIIFDRPNAEGVWASDHFGLLAEFEER